MATKTTCLHVICTTLHGSLMVVLLPDAGEKRGWKINFGDSAEGVSNHSNPNTVLSEPTGT
jgi:hypothetical protein